jgi:hypothetical protein
MSPRWAIALMVLLLHYQQKSSVQAGDSKHGSLQLTAAAAAGAGTAATATAHRRLVMYVCFNTGDRGLAYM